MANVVLAPVHTRLLKTWTAFASGHTALSHTGDTAETTLATIAIPAATMGPNGSLRITTLWSYPNNANNKTCRVRFAGALYFGNNFTTTLSAQIVTFIHNRNAQNSQVGQAAGSTGYGAVTAAVTTSSIDTSAAQNLTITAQCANAADTITLEAYLVEVLYGA